MLGLSTTHLLILVLVLVLLFGSSKLGDLGEGLGKGIRNFKKSMKEANEIDVTPKKTENDETKKS